MGSLKQSKKRVAWVAIVCFTPLFLFFVGWFLYLSATQTYKGVNMLAFAEEERWKAVSTLKAERGEIFDRFGQPIAINIRRIDSSPSKARWRARQTKDVDA